MGNYADNRDARMESDRIVGNSKSKAKAKTTPTGATVVNADDSKGGNFSDPYGASGAASQSVRRRGATEQQRVGQDSRVREDASSGTAGAAGGAMGAAMGQTAGTPVAQPQQNAMWQATRQPTDLASIQQRVLQSLTKPMQRG